MKNLVLILFKLVIVIYAVKVVVVTSTTIGSQRFGQMQKDHHIVIYFMPKKIMTPHDPIIH